MSVLLTGMTLVLCVAMLVAAFVAIRETKGEHGGNLNNTSALPVAILAAGLVSLLASILFLILAAPDVAMTEAAIGSGLTTFLFFFVLARIRSRETQGNDHG